MWEFILNTTLITVVLVGLFYFIKSITRNQKDLPNPPTYTPFSDIYDGNDLNSDSTKPTEKPNDTKHNIEYEEKVDDK